MSDNNSLQIINNNDTNLKNSQRRSHSNTISGGRPPALDIAISRPSNIRRNSEGSPGLPPPICISEPTPIEPSANNGFSNDKNSTTPSSANSSRPATPNSDNNTPPAPGPLPKSSAIAHTGGLLDYPLAAKKKSRPRGSSITSNLINEIKESSTIQSLASKIKSRHSTEYVDSGSRGATTVPTTNSSAPGSVSGVYLANAKRNHDFHALFRSVPEEDSLIEDFGCALQKEILLQGRVYVSENHLCFNANIFGWVTNLVIAFADIIEVEKKTTAYFIPNAIQISTDNAKHFFASFLSRDQAYDLMVDIWHIARPDLMPTKDREDGIVQCADENSSELSEEDSESCYDSDTEDSYSDKSDTEVVATAATSQQQSNGTRPRKVSMASLPAVKDIKGMDAAARRRALSEVPRPNFQCDAKATSKSNASTADIAQKLSTVADASNRKSYKSTDKHQVNEKTECECGANGSHLPNVVSDQVYSGSLEKIYNLLNESDFMKNFLVDNQKSTELTIGEWKKGEGKVVLVREESYIKQLGGAIGPKQTKCVITQEVFHKDFDNFVSILTTTCTPDVPSGGSFSCKTRTCLTWAGKGKVRSLVTVLVDFTKSSWLKSTIEKASIDGQQTYYKELDTAIRTYIKENPVEFGVGSSSQSEGKRRKKGNRSKSSKSTPKPEATEAKPDKVDSAVHQVLGAIANAIADVIAGTIDMIRSPSSSHLTLLFLVAMVFINIFIARKMAYVEQQLSALSDYHASSNMDQVVVKEFKVVQGTHEYNRQEKEDLWDWLGHIDPDKSQVTYPTSDNPEEQEAIWDEAIQASISTKERLDKHMIELSSMIQRAESNLQEVTKAVNEQRQKIKDE